MDNKRILKAVLLTCSVLFVPQLQANEPLLLNEKPAVGSLAMGTGESWKTVQAWTGAYSVAQTPAPKPFHTEVRSHTEIRGMELASLTFYSHTDIR